MHAHGLIKQAHAGISLRCWQAGSTCRLSHEVCSSPSCIVLTLSYYQVLGMRQVKPIGHLEGNSCSSAELLSITLYCSKWWFTASPCMWSAIWWISSLCTLSYSHFSVINLQLVDRLLYISYTNYHIFMSRWQRMAAGGFVSCLFVWLVCRAYCLFVCSCTLNKYWNRLTWIYNQNMISPWKHLTESQNHGIVGAGRDLWDHLLQFPAKAGPLWNVASVLMLYSAYILQWLHCML